ncbi:MULTISPECIES: Gfo/Idh/MocA family protein [Paenibacillus]|jgi:predicted dehydrogenase|uniref:Gfo/Idh/MocA family oxidoreductase n=1 Tax=Paenibacillus oceani TaxID=2772510 RepID=A0A927CB26_9BACL|nr:Gfo/Idh/MocA family oxidoreductase [Paenibacillus oceani]MBD2864390.1 Gfo/Idh/MocA family oxidoreductase [Paenibacillus oceani]MDF2660222.1 oxidoreductase [Paenibacillus sp.]
MSILKVGIIGQGRSGRNIHGNQLIRMSDKFKITAVADGMEDRRIRAEKEYGCKAYASYEEMVANEDLDLVVNASPSDLHYPISLDLLQKGFNVLCEKPLAKTPEEVDNLIAASKASGKVLAVFQQSRYMPAFLKMREIIDSGVLGRIVQVDFTNNGFARRWDWQTLQENNGGNLLNTGPHPVDQALQLFGTDIMPQITCIMDRANTFGDAEDYVKIIMRGQGRPTIDLEISSCSTYPRPQFTIQGTNGGLTGNTQKLQWKYFKSEEAPHQELTRGPLFNANGDPAYCSETLTWYEDSWQYAAVEGLSMFDNNTASLYSMLHNSLTTGAELEITPEQVRQQMAVMAECRRQNPHVYANG